MVSGEKACDIADQVSITDLDSGSFYQDAAILHHVVDPVWLDPHGLVGEDVPFLQ